MIIEARQITSQEVIPSICEWIVHQGGVALAPINDATMLLNTLEGTIRAQVGDWIIKGVAGEFYPCRPDIFAATYEEVLED